MGLLIASEEPESELLTEKDRLTLNQDTIISQFNNVNNADEYSYQQDQTVETGNSIRPNNINNIGGHSSVVSCTDTYAATTVGQQPQPEPEQPFSLTTNQTMDLFDRSAHGD